MMRITANLLVINPGSTSTKLALYSGTSPVVAESIVCDSAVLAACPTVLSQIIFREAQVREFLAAHGVDPETLSAIVTRGGPLRPVAGGVYNVNDAMLADAQSNQFVEHVSRIACVIGARIGRPVNVPVYVVDPVSTDEFDPISRISGLKEIPRLSLMHALNMRAVAKRVASQRGRDYADMTMITAHIGGGTSIAIHHRGRMIDAVDSNGEGPFSPERSGGLRVDSLAQYVVENDLSVTDISNLLTRQGGLMSHLGTTDAREIEQRIDNGDAHARRVYEAMAYAVSKHICSLAAAVNGAVDAVVLTGGLSNSTMLTDWIRERTAFLAPVIVVGGEFEMDALALGALDVLSGKAKALDYPGAVAAS